LNHHQHPSSYQPHSQVIATHHQFNQFNQNNIFQSQYINTQNVNANVLEKSRNVSTSISSLSRPRSYDSRIHKTNFDKSYHHGLELNKDGNNQNNHPTKKIKLPPVSNFYQFKPPIIVNPKRQKISETTTPNSTTTTTTNKLKFIHPMEPSKHKEDKNINQNDIKSIDTQPSSTINHTFKPNTKFLSKIQINESFLLKHIKKDPTIEIDYSLEIQPIELSKDKIMKYVIMEFFFEILKFNDKRDEHLKHNNNNHHHHNHHNVDGSKLIDNIPKNQLILDIKFELEDNKTGMQKFIKIWLKLFKPSDSNISKNEISIELTKYFDKFMEVPIDYFHDKEINLTKLNDKVKIQEDLKKMERKFRPSWRLGAKDELNIIDMKIDIDYEKKN